MIAFFAGLLAGSAHVVAGPDHLAAVAPLAVARPAHAAAAGARWGLGHGLGVVALGALGIAAREAINIETWSMLAEAIVGFMLIAVGLWALRRASHVVIHTHPHAHDGHLHAHPHLHLALHLAPRDHAHPDAHRAHRHAPLWIGALHGIAGAGHLFGVLPALALPTLDAALYLAAYLVGAVASMSLFAALFGRLAQRGGPRVLRRLLQGTGAAAIVVGGVWIGLAFG